MERLLYFLKRKTNYFYNTFQGQNPEWEFLVVPTITESSHQREIN